MARHAINKLILHSLLLYPKQLIPAEHSQFCEPYPKYLPTLFIPKTAVLLSLFLKYIVDNSNHEVQSPLVFGLSSDNKPADTN